MDYSKETAELIERMCRNVEDKELVVDKEKAQELILKTYDLFNLPRPKNVVWCVDPFENEFEKSVWSARSAWSARSVLSSGSAWSASSASSARSAWSAWNAIDYDFDWYIFQFEYCKNATHDKPNEHDVKYLQYCELLIQAKEAGLGYRIEWEDTLYLAPTPIVRLNEDTPPQFHSDQLPAIEWKNGSKFYYLDGVQFEKSLWEKVISQTMNFSEIMAIEISDQRTVALKYNPQAILNEGSELIDKDDRNNELYLIKGKQINKDLGFKKIWFLKMLCPTGRSFIEGVDPDFAEAHPNATECQAELCGLILSEYMSMELES